MNTFDIEALAHTIIEDRLRDAAHRRLARAARRRERPARAQSPARSPGAVPPFWSRAHLRYPYG